MCSRYVTLLLSWPESELFSQCAMPVVEGLLSEPMNTIVLNLLWACAVWHALAKLRLHTESTLSALEVSTTILGDSARRFSKECDKDKYDIRELPAEEYARHRRKTRQQEKKHAKDSQPSKTAQQKPGDSKGKGKEKASGPKQKRLNLQTFKWHNLGHYAAAIRRFGPTDGYSTQMVNLLKSLYLVLICICYCRASSNTVGSKDSTLAPVGRTTVRK